MWGTEDSLRYTCPGERTLTPLCTSRYDLCSSTQGYSRDPGSDLCEKMYFLTNYAQRKKLNMQLNIQAYLQTLLGFNLHFLLSGWLAS